MQIKPAGSRSLLVDLDDLSQVHALWRALRGHPPPGAEEIVAGATSVLVTMEREADVAGAVDLIRSTRLEGSETLRPNLVEIPVMYGGPDLENVCALTGLSADAVVAKHSEADYSVAFLGFSPGFGYLVGADPGLRVSRLDNPRPAVPAGSVALASEFTAVYPQSTPGGWRVIGRTDLLMFDPTRSHPSLLGAGDTVRFVATSTLGPAPAWGHVPLPPVSGDYVLVIDAGPLTTIQDAGRPGWAHLGVPRAGAADQRSAALANRLVGNEQKAALLESTLSGPALRIGCDRRVAVTGARAAITVDGIPARAYTALTLRAGSEIRVASVDAGARVYVAFSGGLTVDPVMGSRSTDTLSGIGPPPLKPGDVLALGAPDGDGLASSDSAGTTFPRPGELISVAAVPGPRDDWIGKRGMETLAGAVFDVAPTSDRTGLRLSGAPVGIVRREELPSEGVVAGAIQVPPGGDPIVLLRNHPTTGGYPVAAVVTDDGIDALAQARPGVRVRFELG